jgi:ATP-binding cassette, subfamily B, bacterial PglK
VKRLLRTVRELMPLLPPGARKFLGIYAFALSALAVLDIAALGLLAAVLSPLVGGQTTVTLPVIGEISGAQTLGVLGLAAGLMVLKSIIAVAWNWVATRRMASYELAIGDRLFGSYIRASWTDRLSRSTAELVRLADVGIANTMTGVLMPAASIPGEIFTTLAVLLVLFVAQPTTAAVTVLYLGVVALFLYFVITRRSLQAGRVSRDYSFRVARLMTEMVGTLKEIVLRDKLDDVGAVIHHNRSFSTRARANLQFLAAVPKFVVESALVVGFILVGGVAYLEAGLSGALSAVALFGIAGLRIVPAVVRFQTLMSTTAAAIPHAEAVVRDIHTTERFRTNEEVLGDDPLAEHPRDLVLKDVSFTYPGSADPALKAVDLTVPLGTSLALVGRSGAGKSTLVDLLLGLLTTTDGSITVDDKNLADVLKGWRSKVGYVPQDVALFDATIAQNVALTWGDDADEERVLECLDLAQLTDTVAQRSGGIHARIGERGLALSGGQRQRLGIARALYSQPLVLVMDEATSALDTTTEEAITRSIARLHGDVTVVAVAHRLSTIRHFDQICFMENARVVQVGAFDELVADVPAFALQAQLAGLVGPDGKPLR